MGNWCNWYRVVKACGRDKPRYIYDQSTRRVGDRTETKNRYIGILGGASVRVTRVGQPVKAQGKVGGGKEGKIKAKMLKSQNAWAAIGLRGSAGVNAASVYGQAGKLGVNLAPWVFRVNAEQDSNKKKEIGAELIAYLDEMAGSGSDKAKQKVPKTGAGDIPVVERVGGVWLNLREVLGEIRDASIGEDRNVGEEVISLLDDLDNMSPEAIVSRLDDIRHGAETRFMKEELGEVISGLQQRINQDVAAKNTPLPMDIGSESTINKNCSDDPTLFKGGGWLTARQALVGLRDTAAEAGDEGVKTMADEMLEELDGGGLTARDVIYRLGNAGVVVDDDVREQMDQITRGLQQRVDVKRGEKFSEQMGLFETDGTAAQGRLLACLPGEGAFAVDAKRIALELGGYRDEKRGAYMLPLDQKDELEFALKATMRGELPRLSGENYSTEMKAWREQRDKLREAEKAPAGVKERR